MFGSDMSMLPYEIISLGNWRWASWAHTYLPVYRDKEASCPQSLVGLLETMSTPFPREI
jgi:hypothetical protein